MNLFFAYVLAVCPVLNDLITGLLICALIVCAVFFYRAAFADIPLLLKMADARIMCRTLKIIAILTFLWVLVPSQKRLDAMLLNHSAACVDMRDEYGVRLGDK